MSERDERHSRSERSRKAIRNGTIELLASGGAGSVTHQRVAEVSGVGRATVYRHFPTVTDLVEDAFLGGGIPSLDLEVNGPPAAVLRSVLDALVDELADPGTLAVITTVLDRARTPGGARRLRDAYAGSLLDQLADLLRSTWDHGVGLSDAQVGHLFDLLLGPVLCQVLVRGSRPTADELDDIVAAALKRLG